ncbi:chromate transporter [Paenibacillus albiflavus]|uniref:Chromate transporter n=2 Tax=Paenibacillus albiflavus TaxID=2545760 RepID=A0A4R4E2Y0_9BACL|nr:chromate transporter [Paenibacillus albiflavus]
MNTKQNLYELWKLFVTFVKIGPVTFGGGYAMIPLIEKEIVHKQGWVKSSDVADVFALAQSIPGAIAINVAAFIGYKMKRTVGAVAALLGVLLPTFLIVLGLCIGFLYVRDNPYIVAAFKGMGAAVVALIVYAGIKTGRTSIVDISTLLIAIVALLLLLYLQVNSILLIVAGGFVGIIVMQVKRVARPKSREKHIEEGHS